METLNQTPANGIRKETTRSSIICEKVYKSDFQKKGTLTAQIRQIITTTSLYPSQRVSNNLQSNVFGAADFGFEDKKFESVETRVAWIPVPEGTTVEQVQSKLDAAHKNGACIYKVLSSQPVLSDDQKYAIKAGLRTLDQFAASQAVRFPDNETTQADGTANKLILDKNGNVQYRRTFFFGTTQEDVDVRGQEVPYLPEELEAEIKGASVMVGQTI